jgi:hypothetical protein
VAIDHSLQGTPPILPAGLLAVGFDQEQNAAVVGLRDWWDEVLSTSPNYRQTQVLEHDQLLGRIAYFVRRTRLGFKWGRNPDWSIPKTPCLDPRLTSEHRAAVLEALIKQLPRHLSFFLVFREGAGWSPDTISAFTRNGFEHARGPTYRWGPEDGDILDLMKSKARSQLKLAQKRLDVTEINANAFLGYYRRNLERDRVRALHPLSLAKDLLDAGVARGKVRITAARRSSGSTDFDAAIACTWDDDSYYYWMSSHGPSAPCAGSGRPQKDAVKVLILDAMRHAKALGLAFDTDGTASVGAEHLYRDILKLRRTEIRHVFKRTSGLVARYERCRPLLLSLKQKIYRAV